MRLASRNGSVDAATLDQIGLRGPKTEIAVAVLTCPPPSFFT